MECGSDQGNEPKAEKTGTYQIHDIEVPIFDFSCWSPRAPSGLSFLSLLPIQEVCSCPSKDSPEKLATDMGYQQNDLRGKMKTSTAHRKKRLKSFTSGTTTARNIVDEKKLRHAVDADDTTLVEEILKSGVDPSGGDDKRRPPLHIASAKGNEGIVKLLLDYGADPNQKDIIGNTPLHLAACTSKIRVITMLLQAGTDVNTLDNSGRSPLHLARSRLRLLMDSTTFNSEQLKVEVANIVYMMKEYLYRSGKKEDATQLDDLCNQLDKTTTKEEVDAVSELLNNFTSLTLEKETQNHS